MVEVAPANEFRFISLGNNTWRLANYTGNRQIVSIPSEYNRGTVVEISDSAFYGCDGIETLVIPDTITSIGQYAFEGCTAEIIWGDNPRITEIGSYTFSKYKGTSITIPDSVTNIGQYAFRYCNSLESITLPFVGATKNGTSNTHFGYIFGASSYSYNDDYVPTTLKEVIITGGTSIGYEAFRGCTALTSITIPDSVTSIGSGAFRGCSSLESITIPFVGEEAGKTYSDKYEYHFGYIFGKLSYSGGTAVKQTYVYGSSPSGESSSTYYIPSSLRNVTVTGGNIRYGAFENCSMLTSVTIGNGVASIDMAFSNCSGLTSIYYTGDMASWLESGHGWGVLSSGRTLYIGGNKVEGAIAIPDGVTRISSCAFAYQKEITSVTIPDSVTSIDSGAFNGCSGLTSITIPDSVTSIESGAFYDCSGLTSIVIPDSVTSIGREAFRGCTGLTSVTIGNGVTSIGYSAFEDCTGLTSVIIPDSVTSIGYGAFNGCSSLESITIPFVGDEAGKTSSDTYQYPFGYIFGTSSYTGGERVTQYYFGSNTSNTTVGYYYIPSSLRSVVVTGGNILYGAFYNCSMLTFVTIPDSVTSIGGSAFAGCSSLTSITIPDSVKSIGSSAFNNCRAEINWGDDPQIMEISGHTFYGYRGLRLIIPGSVTSIRNNAFDGCLAEIAWGDNPQITEIGEEAFYGYEGPSVVIPDSVTSIGDSAFYRCSGLTSITIPNSVTSIGKNAFYGCSGLTSVNYNGTKAQWNAIGKSSFWKNNSAIKEVVCTDGTITL